MEAKTMQNPKYVPTNQEVGERIGLDHSSVSRIRAGERTPSLDAMGRIEAAYGWTIQDQFAARVRRQYHIQFESVIRKVTA